MSCGKDLPGRIARVDPKLARRLFRPLAAANDADIYGWVWSNESSAAESARLNRKNHGHTVYGPAVVEGGYVTALDLRPAIARFRAAGLEYDES